jgi:hypothetical protein
MKFRQFFNWRFSLIFFHRWLGILVGLMFVIWSLSGIVLMYAGIPHMTAGERLHRLPALDLATVSVTPAEALGQVQGAPFRLRVSMHGDRPVYRINTGFVFGNWTVVYADTGERVPDLDAEAATAWLTDFLPDYEGGFVVETTLQGPDMFTHSPGIQNHMPMHRIALDDASDTEYYMSAGSMEPVMKTTFWTRILGFSGYNMHTLFFFRQASWWTPLLQWLAWIGLGMVILGVVLGIWRFNFRKKVKKTGEAWRTPYSGWHKWHHWAGIIFGIMAVSWVSSGLVSLNIFPVITETLYTEAQIEAGARSVQGQGDHIDFSPLTVAGLQHAATELASEFAISEMELIEFNGNLYYLAYRKPDRQEMLDWDSRSAFDFITPTLEWEHRLISATDTGAQPFSAFGEAELLAIARQALPGATITEAAWLDEPDSYYYRTVDSFDLGLPRSVRQVPVLRVKFDDPQSTWLYLEPSLGQLTKLEVIDRRNRWGYYGLHGLDFAFLYTNRPLWDIIMLSLVIGVVTLSVTTLVPGWRRVRKNVLKITRLGRQPAEQEDPAFNR